MGGRGRAGVSTSQGTSRGGSSHHSGEEMTEPPGSGISHNDRHVSGKAFGGSKFRGHLAKGFSGNWLASKAHK